MWEGGGHASAGYQGSFPRGLRSGRARAHILAAFAAVNPDERWPASDVCADLLRVSRAGLSRRRRVHLARVVSTAGPRDIEIERSAGIRSAAWMACAPRF